jgi:hypothetical protein
MYNEGEADERGNKSSILLKTLAAPLLYSQPDTCRGFGDIMIAT